MVFTLYIIIFICVLYFIFGSRGVLVDPSFTFIFFNVINYWGTYALFDFTLEADVIHFYLLSTAMTSLVLGAFFGSHIFSTYPIYKNWLSRPLIVEQGKFIKLLVISIILISIVIAILYYIAVGYNIFILGFLNLISGGTALEDVSTLRLATYNSTVGGRYLFPGYVNQFKNTLLPILTAYLCYRRKVFQKPTPLSYYFLIIITLIFIFGTGQRGAFVLASLMIGSFIYSLSKPKQKRKLIVFGGGGVLFFFLITSIFIGRGIADKEMGLLEVVPGLFESLKNRITTANQLGSLVGFREIIYKTQIQWGKEWGQAFIGLLPGVPGSNLSAEIFSILYGGHGERGTAPPSSWVSVYYNFGWIGIITLPFVMTFSLKYMFYRFLTSKKTLLRTIVYFCSFILISTWIAGSPTYFFNVGLFAIIGFYMLVKISHMSFGRITVLVSNQ